MEKYKSKKYYAYTFISFEDIDKSGEETSLFLHATSEQGELIINS